MGRIAEVVEEANIVAHVVGTMCYNMSSFISHCQPDVAHKHEDHSHSNLYYQSRIILAKKWINDKFKCWDAHCISYIV